MIDLRRIWTQVEEVHHEFGPRPARPLLRGIVAAVITNPYAGRYEPNILPLMEALNPLGLQMSRRLLDAIGLGWHPGCLSFHLNETPSNTASAVQVRSRVYTSSVGKWRTVAQQLEPFAAILRAAGIRVPD